MVQPKRADIIKSSGIKRMVVRIGALDKNGKSTWALTAPPPIAYLDLNNRAEHVLDRFVGRGIYHYKFDTLRASGQDDYRKLWEKYQLDFDDAIASDARSLVIDTDNDLWELRRLAQWGRESSVPDQYGALNKDFRNMYDTLLSTDKNLVVVSEKRKKYITKQVKTKTGFREAGEWDGAYEFGGWSGTGFKVQLNTEIEYRLKERQFVLTVVNCGLINPFIAGDQYVGALCNFPFLAADVFPGTDIVEDWGYDDYVSALAGEG